MKPLWNDIDEQIPISNKLPKASVLMFAPKTSILELISVKHSKLLICIVL